MPEHLAPDYDASFTTAVRRTLARPLRFRGIASRREFWWSCLAWVGLAVAVMLPLGLLAEWVSTRVEDPAWPTAVIGTSGQVLLLAVAFVYLLPLTVRRLHDGGCSGWWMLLVLVPFGIYTLIGILALVESRPWLWRPQWIGEASSRS